MQGDRVRWLTNISIEYADRNNGRERPENVPEQEVCIFKNIRRAPRAIDLEPPQNAYTHNVLIEEIDDPASRYCLASYKPMSLETDMLPLRA